MLDIRTLFVNVSAFFKAFLRTSVLHTLMIVIHVIFIFNICSLLPVPGLASLVAMMSVRHVEFHTVHVLSWADLTENPPP